MDLLYRIPMCVIRIYGRAVERLQARESMREAERMGVGTGSMKPRDSRSIQQRWQREAGMGRSQKRRLQPGQLGAIGIGFKKVPAKPKA